MLGSMGIFPEKSARFNQSRKPKKAISIAALALVSSVALGGCNPDSQPNPGPTSANSAPDIQPQCKSIKVVHEGGSKVEVVVNTTNAEQPGIYDTVASIDFGDGSNERTNETLTAYHTYANIPRKMAYSVGATVLMQMADGSAHQHSVCHQAVAIIPGNP